MNGNSQNAAQSRKTTEKSSRFSGKALAKRRILVQKEGGVDRPFLICIILLLCMGTVMVFSSSYPYAKENFGDSYRFAKMQILFAAAGLFVMTVVAKKVSYHFIRKMSKPVMIVSLCLLAAVLVMGSGAKGATRWLQIGPISFQPSEIMKFAVVLFFADYADKYAKQIATKDKLRENWVRITGFLAFTALAAAVVFLVENRVFGIILGLLLFAVAVFVIYPVNLKENLPGVYYGILPYLGILVIIGVLLYLQPHLSGLVIIAGIIFFMMLIGGTPFKYLFCGVGVGLAAFFVLATSMSHSSSRLAVWKDPFEHIIDGGWQPVQSLYAIGSGGLTGVGFGNSRQKHLYLPEPQNDYIFSIWCEEMGFIGALFLICVFMFFIYRGIVIGLKAPDKFSSMLVIGIIMHVGLQVVLNIAVVTNTLPSTGISLPFFSYGGTSLMILLAEMGVVLSVSRMSSIEKT